MPDHYSVVWTPKAEKCLLRICKYLLSEWGQRCADDFLDKIERLLNRVQSGVLVGQTYQTYRKIVVNRQVTMFYYTSEEHRKIYIIYLHSNHQNPQKIDSI